MSNLKTAELTFEQAMARLAEIVSAMEGDCMPLEDMVSGYEEGAKLLTVCRSRIESARQRIEIIAKRASGEPVLAPFAMEAEPASSPSPAPAARPAPAPAKSFTQARRKPALPDDDEDSRLF